MRIKIALFCFLLTLFISCKNTPGFNEHFKYQVKIDTVFEAVDMERVIKNYEYIQLETNKDCLIGEVKKLLVDDEKIFVLSNGVYCFDHRGKFLFALNKFGKAPSEFIQATDISIDNGQLYLYDNSQYKVLKFDAGNGKFTGSFSLKYSAKEVQFIGNYLFSNRGAIPNPYIKGTERLLISTIDQQDKITAFFPFNDYDISIEKQFYSYNKYGYWIDPIFNKVYRLDGAQVENYIRYDYPKHNVSKTDVSANSALQELRKKGKAFFISDVFETESFIYCNMVIGEKPYKVVYDKLHKKSLVFNRIRAKPYQLSPNVKAVYKDRFYNILSSFEVSYSKNYAIDEKFTLGSKAMDFSNYAVVNNLQENNNPVIAIYKFKVN